MGCVYSIQRKLNLKAYVGQTVKRSSKERYGSFSKPPIDPRSKRAIDNAFKKHGGEAFHFTDLMLEVPDRDLDFWERFWIKIFDSNNREIGYNLESGGNKKKKVNPEVGKMRGDKMRGKKYSPEKRESFREYWDSLKGVSKSWPDSRKASYTIQKHPLYKKRVWIHPIHGTFEGGIIELMNAFAEQKLNRGNLCGIARGYYGRNTHKGWTVQQDDLVAANN